MHGVDDASFTYYELETELGNSTRIVADVSELGDLAIISREPNEDL